MKSETTQSTLVFFKPAEFSNIEEFGKIDRYCEKILGHSFRTHVQKMILGLIEKIQDQIKSAEELTGQNYLQIKDF